jgi:hypothetical protein
MRDSTRLVVHEMHRGPKLFRSLSGRGKVLSLISICKELFTTSNRPHFQPPTRAYNSVYLAMCVRRVGCQP